MKGLDLVGIRYGNLIVIERAPDVVSSGCIRRVWKCRCNCGSETLVRAGSLQSGNSRSCGCLRENRKTTHGETKTKEYRAWAGIWQRCHNPNNRRFADYGGRGISVCDEWKSFEKFLSDMGRKPSDEHSIDRINNSLGYFSENCKWSTRSEQQRNKRRNSKASMKLEA